MDDSLLCSSSSSSQPPPPSSSDANRRTTHAPFLRTDVPSPTQYLRASPKPSIDALLARRPDDAEGDYNDRVSTALPVYAHMDQNMISVGGGHSTVEFSV